VVLTNENQGVTATENKFLLIDSQQVLAWIGHHQVILEEIHKW
jgi:hypothetical protein